MRDNPIATFLIPTLRGDGAVRMMLILAEELIHHGYHVDLLVIRCEGELLSQIPHDVQLIDLAATRSTMAVPAIVRYLRKSRPKVFFATERYSGLPAMYASVFSCTNTSYFIRQDTTWSKDTSKLRGYNRWLVSLAARILFKRATIIAVSQGVADDFSSEFPTLKNHLIVIYNPVIDSKLYSLAHEKPTHLWLTDKHIPVIIAVGRLALAKGFDILLSAFSMLLDYRPAHLLIVGEGPERANLELLISQNELQDNCQLLGFQQNPYGFMAASDVFVLSSRWEGLPTVLIEALAVGIPVVATDCPHGPREILDGGRFGTLVPTENPHALCAALIDALSYPSVHDDALDTWLSQFTVERSISAHLKLLES